MGLANFATCHPSAVSSVKAAEASFVPVEVHKVPTCNPDWDVSFQNLALLTVPSASAVNWVPNSTEVISDCDTSSAGAELPQIVTLERPPIPLGTQMTIAAMTAITAAPASAAVIRGREANVEW